MPEPLAYMDFELDIAPGEGRIYQVAVLDSPEGQVRAEMHFPFSSEKLENYLLKIKNALLASGGPRRRSPMPHQLPVQEFGQKLFDALFNGEVMGCYRASQAKARAEEKGLRLKLRIRSPELAALPWEFLYDSREGEYVCFCNSPIVRYPEAPQPVRALEVTPPLRILGVAAAPKDLPPIDIAEERRLLENSLANLAAVELHWAEGGDHGATWRSLHDALQAGPWHILHFIGHGDFDEQRQEGTLAFAGDNGNARYLHASELARMLRRHTSLRLAVLNACQGAQGSATELFSSAAAILIRSGLPAVVAMQYPITDAAAIELARAFYRSLANGLPVDTALTEARTAISLEVPNSVEWGTPVLYLRAPDGRLFDLQPAAPTDDRRPSTAAPLENAIRDTPPAATPAPEIFLELSAAPNPAPVGAEVLWAVHVRNFSPGTVGNLELAHGLDMLSEEPFSVVHRNQYRATFTKIYDRAGEYTETVRLFGGYSATASATLQVIQPPHFQLTLQPRHEAAQVGVSVDWIAIVVNDGGAPLEDVSVRSGRKLLADPFNLAMDEKKVISFRRDYDQPGSPSEKVVVVAYARGGDGEPGGRERLQQEASANVKITAAREETLTLAPGTNLELVRIPGGEFWMGSDPEKDPQAKTDEQPQHQVFLDGYFIGKYPITVAQFAAFVKATDYKSNASLDLKQKADHPAVEVAWKDAVAFCEWASEVTGRKVVLPSEAQWEKAARGSDGRIYPWGDEAPDANRCNFNNNVKATTPVGKYSPQGDSPYGCADMAGNVWEWCADWYAGDYYQKSPAANPPGPAKGERRVLRGGSFDFLASHVRCAYRGRNDPDLWNIYDGFRVVVLAASPIAGS